jgi:DMSO/TMAO reductase YedYZ molybdopterin-dependent catalytic subunit
MTNLPSIPPVGDGSGIEESRQYHEEELQLAFRNKALPLEGLRYDVTPVGMHYTLTHYDTPFVSPTDWQLVVSGAVRQRLTLGLAELERRPARTLRVTLECAGDGRALLHPRPISQPWLTGGVSTAEWTGTPLRMLLDEVGPNPDVTTVVFTGLDHGIEGGVEQDYQRALPLEEARKDEVLLAWAMNGRPLEPQHGYPVRLVVPSWYGMTHVKWLRAIDLATEPFEGYQNAVAYRYSPSRAEPGEPVSLMRVRSLLIPPGFPDFLTRTRIVRRGSVELAGRAWSGFAPISRVDVSVDGGRSWAPAEVGEATHPYSWQWWSYHWQATAAGVHELCCRATDAAGNVQPLEPFWTARGMGNNGVQRLQVVVE